MKKMVLFIGLMMIIVLAACNGGGEEETAVVPAVQTVIVVATPTAATDAATAPTAVVATDGVAAVNTDAESAPVADAPVMEMAEVSSGEPMMTALVDLNVRTGPGTQYPPVGVLRAGDNARVVGKTNNGYWWKIDCPAGAGTECWSSAGNQYSTSANTSAVAVAAIPPAPPTATSSSPSSSPTYTPDPYATATYTPDPHATATYTPDPHATATYTPDPHATTTPTYTPDAHATATYTPDPHMTTTPTAEYDNDSRPNPAQDVFFSPTGTHHFSHSEYVSNPDGDYEDWVQFTFPNNSNSSQQVWITLDCMLTGDAGAQLRATVWEDGMKTNKVAYCNGGETSLTVDNTKVQQLQIDFGGWSGSPVYASYTATVVGYR